MHAAPSLGIANESACNMSSAITTGEFPEPTPTLTKGTRKLVKVMKDHARVHEHAPV